MNNIPKIVLTGGPCGGKTEGLSYLSEHLTALGFNVFAIKESAEALIASGFDRRNTFEFQKAIALNQLRLEKEAEILAKKSNKSVIICDRGLMDAKVYLSETDFQKFKEELKLNEDDLLNRYDAVFLMDSMSQKGFIEDNGIRNETPDQADILNKKSLQIWSQNPNFKRISVYESFDEKLERLLKEVTNVVQKYFYENL